MQKFNYWHFYFDQGTLIILIVKHFHPHKQSFLKDDNNILLQNYFQLTSLAMLQNVYFQSYYKSIHVKWYMLPNVQLLKGIRNNKR